ncbi:MAG: Zn-dependent hydrolase [Devosia sp.]
MTTIKDLRADQDRYWASIMASAKIGPGRPGGLSRLTLSKADGEMRDLFVDWCQKIGLGVEVDEVGSIFATYEGREPHLPPVYVGSHLDSQINGGRFDGIAGVLAGLEVCRRLADVGHRPRRSITVVDWTNEEGARFSPPMVASGCFVGAHTVDWVHALTDVDGIRFVDALEAIGYRGTRPCRPVPVDAYFEFHIEQGPILDAQGHDVGVVTGGYPSTGIRAVFKGRTAHTGPTPMDGRHNALAAAARWLTAVDDIGWAFAIDDGKATAAKLDAWPNRAGILSDWAEAVCDVRHPDPMTQRAMAERMRRALQEAAARAGCTAEIADEWNWGGDIFNADLVELVRGEAMRLGLNWRDIKSQAGHDAYFMATHCPTAMVFAPCKDGITHNNEEDCRPEQLFGGLNVLLQAVIARADRP